MDAKIGPNVNFKHMFFILNRTVWFQTPVNSVMKSESDFSEVVLIGIQDGEKSLDHSSNGVSRGIGKALPEAEHEAWGSSVNTTHSEEWRELGSCPADLVGSGNSKIGQNNESQCEKPFMRT